MLWGAKLDTEIRTWIAPASTTATIARLTGQAYYDEPPIIGIKLHRIFQDFLYLFPLKVY
jgi:hypothetical protein